MKQVPGVGPLDRPLENDVLGGEVAPSAYGKDRRLPWQPLQLTS
jgi:hypothetical protein